MDQAVSSFKTAIFWDNRLVDAHVRRLRVKVEDHADDPKIILTARGLGYRLISTP